jgi:hypothetical protein
MEGRGNVKIHLNSKMVPPSGPPGHLTLGFLPDHGANRKEPDHFLFADKSLGITLSDNATSWGV